MGINRDLKRKRFYNDDLDIEDEFYYEEREPDEYLDLFILPAPEIGRLLLEREERNAHK